jgi:hypothetical protein
MGSQQVVNLYQRPTKTNHMHGLDRKSRSNEVLKGYIIFIKSFQECDRGMESSSKTQNIKSRKYAIWRSTSWRRRSEIPSSYNEDRKKDNIIVLGDGALLPHIMKIVIRYIVS